MSYNSDNGSLSEFNEASFKMGRIGSIQENLNYARLQPLSFFPEFNCYGYLLSFNSAVSGLEEVFPHLKKEEKENGNKIREALEEFMEKYPIVTARRTINGKTKVFIDLVAFKVFKKELTVFEQTVRIFLKEHKMDTPTQEAQGLF